MRLLEVDVGAKSVNCRHCHKRVITEELTVKDYVAVRRFETANRMIITKKGIVYAAVRADHLEVDGVLEGSALALGTIRLTKRARVKGPLRGLALAVDVGATLVGDVRIGPDEVPELARLDPDAVPRKKTVVKKKAATKKPATKMTGTGKPAATAARTRAAKRPSARPSPGSPPGSPGSGAARGR